MYEMNILIVTVNRHAVELGWISSLNPLQTKMPVLGSAGNVG